MSETPAFAWSRAAAKSTECTGVTTDQTMAEEQEAFLAVLDAK
jgi:hypothetical protein